MRSSFGYVLIAVLSLAACSKDKEAAPTPTPAPTAATPPATPAPAPAPSEKVFSREELDHMVAPIALYPDELLAQVLMAATYPGDVADAVTWSKAHPDAKGEPAVAQVANEPWDPSVQALVAFPQALAVLGQDPAWVHRLGDAFLAQPGEVMDAVQRLRRQAQSAGNLESNEYQRVTVQPAAPAEPAVAPATGAVIEQPATQTIIIEPSDPEVVYVPSYNPTQVYGTWAYPSYPPAYYPPSPGYYMGTALATGLAWGVGIAAADALWGDCDWGGNDIDIDVDSYNSFNSNRQIDRSQNSFRHNAANRDGVPYRDSASREQFGRQLDGASQRSAFRGDDPARAAARERARQSMEQRGVQAPARSNTEARQRAQAAQRDMRDRPQAQPRDRQREQAAQTARDRTQAQQRDSAQAQQRDRAQAQQRDRAQAQQRDRAQAQQRAQSRAGGSSRERAQTHQQRGQNNTQARNSARQQQARSQGSRDNAFAGARSPSQSRAQTSRGHSSAQRSQGSRGGGGGQQVQRQSRSPQRQGGGRR